MGYCRRYAVAEGSSVIAFALTLRFLVGAVFAAAGGAKVARLARFEVAIDRFDVVPDALVPLTAAAVAVAELAAGLALVAGFFTAFAASVVAGLLTVFAVVIGINLVRGRKFDCGCGTAAVGREISWALVAQDVSLAIAAIVVAVEAPTQLALDGSFGGGSYSVERALAAPVSAVLLLSGAALAREGRAVRRLLE